MASGSSDPGRLLSFADNVFAFAITLLVLEIRLPQDSELPGDLGIAILQLWPTLIGYVVGFAVIGIMWINHHNLMTLIDRVDQVFIGLTLLLLLCVAFLPFPTAVMMAHLMDPEERAIAVAFYCGWTTLATIVYLLTWRHASRRRRLIANDVPEEVVRATTRAYLPVPFLYLAATLLSFVHVAVSLSIIVAVGFVYLLPKVRAQSAVAKKT